MPGREREALTDYHVITPESAELVMLDSLGTTGDIKRMKFGPTWSMDLVRDRPITGGSYDVHIDSYINSVLMMNSAFSQSAGVSISTLSESPSMNSGTVSVVRNWWSARSRSGEIR